MDAYWSLSEYQCETRQKGFLNLHSTLNNNADELLYSIRRLIRGLGSNRKCARIGYFSSLLWVLRDFKTNNHPKISEFIDMMDKFIPVKSSGEDLNSSIIGRILCVRCFLLSGIVEDTLHVIKLIEGLLDVLKYADRRLHFSICSLISDILTHSSLFTDISRAHDLIANKLPMMYDSLSDTNYPLLLTMLYDHKHLFKQVYKTWKPLLFQKDENKQNIVRFLHNQVEPWVIQSFQLAFGLAIKMNKFDDCWQCFSKSFQIDNSEVALCANAQYVILNVIEFVAKHASINQPETDFLLSILDLKLLLPVTVRNRYTCKSTMSALANLVAKTEKLGRTFNKRIIKHFTESDIHLLSVYLFSLRQFLLELKNNAEIKWLLKYLFKNLKLSLDSLLNASEHPKACISKACFLIDQTSHTIKAAHGYDGVLDSEIAIDSFSLKIRNCQEFCKTNDKILPLSVSKLFERFIYDMIHAEMSSTANLVLCEEHSAYEIFKALENEFEGSCLSVFQKNRRCFKYMKKNGLNLPNHLKKTFIALSWICFLYSIDDSKTDTGDLLSIMKASQPQVNSQADSDSILSWTRVFCDFVLSLVANASHFMHSSIFNAFKLTIPELDIDCLKIFLNAIKDKHDESNDDRDDDDEEEDVNLSDIDNNSNFIDEDNLSKKFIKAKQRIKKLDRTPESVFKSRCVDFVFAFVDKKPNLFVQCMPDIVQLIYLPRDVLPQQVSLKIKSHLQQISITKKNKVDNQCLPIDIYVNSFCQCLLQISSLGKNPDQQALLIRGVQQLMMAMGQQQMMSLDDNLKNVIEKTFSEIVSLFFAGKYDVMQTKLFLDTLLKVPLLAVYLLNDVIDMSLSKENLKPHRITASSQIIKSLLTKETARVEYNDRYLKRIVDYLLWLLKHCHESKNQGVRKFSLFFQLVHKVLRLNILDQNNQTILLSTIKNNRTKYSEILGVGFANRCMTIIDTIERKLGYKANSTAATKPSKQDKTVPSKEIVSTTNGHESESVLTIDCCKDSCKDSPFGLKAFKGLSSLLSDAN